MATRPFKCPGKRACPGSLPAFPHATRGGALRSAGHLTRAFRKWAWRSAVRRRWLGAVRRGGRGLREEAWAAAAAPLPRAALSARREAAAVGGFAGLCSWDFGSASGTRALVSGARSGGATRERAGAGGPPDPGCEAPG